MANNTSDDELEKWLDRQLTGDLATGNLETELRMAVSAIRDMSSQTPKDYAVQPLMRFIKKREEQVALKARIDEIEHLDNEYQEDAQDWMRDHPGYTTAMIPMNSYIKRKKELEEQLTATSKGYKLEEENLNG